MAYEQIWAPWRMGYILGERTEAPEPAGPEDLLPGADPKCFLCQCVADAENRQRLVVCRHQQALCVLNRYPYNNGHLLVAPLRHLAWLDELGAEDQGKLMQMICRMVKLLQQVLQPEGFNVGLNLGQAAGAGLPGHLHWHIVPRWNGDTNFMPSIAAVNVIPQSLEELWEKLRETLGEAEGDV